MKKIQDTIGKIEGLDPSLMAAAQARLDNLTKPLGSLGRLEELAKHAVGITRKENPEFRNKVIFTLAADHGVTAEGVSPFPKEVTAQMVQNFINGGAGINVLAKHVGARVVVVDIGVASDIKPRPGLLIRKINHGTKNMAQGPAMTAAEAVSAVRAGIEIFEEEFSAGGKGSGIDIVGTGEMGIGNTTAASAITACLTGRPVEEVTGRGAGLDARGLKNKVDVIKKALFVNKPDTGDPMNVLFKVGGFEIAGLAGIILAAAAHRVPVVIDGFISGAAALVAFKIEPKAGDYMIAGHQSVEAGHKIILQHIGLRPLLDLNLRLGEGTGAALGISLVEAASKILAQMATFKSAKVSEKNI